MSLLVSIRPEFRILRSIFSLAIALSPAILFGQGGDSVPNYVVNTIADDATGTAANCTSLPEGICTLRDALAAANAVTESNITFAPTVFLASNSAAANTITLANGNTLYIPSGATITGLTSGSGATLTNLVTVNGNNATQVLTVALGVTGAVIANLNVTGGNSLGGGGGVNSAGQLTVTGSIFSGNTANGNGGAMVCGSSSSACDLTVTDSTFSGNSSPADGGAIYAVGSDGNALTVTGSTFNGNSASIYGGAIWQDGGSLTVTGSTFSGNSANLGGGIYESTTFNIANSIVEGNTVINGGSYPDIDGPVNDLGGNLINTSASTTVVNPNLSPLGNYGGPFQTMLPEPGSAAICGGIAANIPAGDTTDQRGYPIENTTYPGYSSSTPCVDSGAVQTNYALAFTTQPPEDTDLDVPFAPAPVVTLTESGNLASAATGTVRMTDSADVLSGTTSEGLSSGAATFPDLIMAGAASEDIFTAWLGLDTMLNISAQASVVVSTAAGPAIMLSPTPGTTTILGTSNIQFQWSTGVDVTSYELLIGTSGVGSSNILNTGVIGTTSYTLPTLPYNGVTVYVRLGSLINGAWQTEDYQYTEATPVPAIMLSPTPGITTILGTSNILFQWSTGTEVTSYELLIGTSGVGSSNILNTGVIGTTSYTLSTLPFNGGTVYVRLGSLMINGAWQTEDYQYTESVDFFVVNTTADDATGSASNCIISPGGICTLRDALAAANAITVSNITFAPTVFLATNSAAANTITLANGTLNIPSGATITGLTSGSGVSLTNLVTVSGNNATTVFTVASGVTGAVIANLNIINGNSANGGGINNAGTLTVTGSSLSGNNVDSGGGAIYSDGTVTVVDSSITGNLSEISGGGIYNDGTLTVMGSTFYGNIAADSGDGAGGGIDNNGTLTVTGSTFSNNRTRCITTFYFEEPTCSENGPAIVSNSSMVLNNSILTGDYIDGEDYGESCCYTVGTGDIIDQDGTQVNLAPLGSYGGPTRTVLPLLGSTAICGGLAANIPAGVTTDQRGYPIKNTTYPGYSSSTPCVDSGAVQTHYALAFTTPPPENTDLDVPFAPAPVVTLTESGNLASAATGTVRMTDSADVLSGTTSEGLSAGAATFPDLMLAGAASEDILTAWLGLDPMLNLSAQASVAVSTAAGPAIMLSPTPGTATILGTSNIQFQWSTGADVTSYELLVGISGVGSSNILNTGVISTTSYTLPTLPDNGATVYVRLGSLINGAWQREDYQYTESVAFFVVNTTADDAAGSATNCTSSPEGICTLRDALSGASADSSRNITFDPAVFLATNSAAANTITLTNGTLNIPSGATITGLTGGSGVTLTNLVTVSGNNATTVFNVASGVTGAVIANLNIINGNSANGGGINNAGTLTVTASSFNLNNAANSGGAIYSDGTMTVVDSSISQNVSQEFGGGISNDGTLTVMGSTFYGNAAGNGKNGVGAGGGIYDDGTLTVTGSTFSQNRTVCEPTDLLPTLPTCLWNGPAIYSPGQWNGPAIWSTVDTVVVNNSIMTQDTINNYPQDEDPYPDGLYFPGTGDIVDQDGTQVNLAPLGNYGGPTPTMLPLPGSTAICGGLAANIPAGVTIDQRGYPIKNTTYPGYSSSTPCVDSGAVQTNYALAFTTQPPANATVDVAIAPAPVVALTESANPAGAAAGTVTMTDSSNALSGTTSEGLSSGTATFPDLILAADVSDDIFTASLGLNPSLNLSTQASVGVTIPLPATVTLGDLTQAYTGSPLPVTATTTPPGLTVNITYNGSPNPPTTVGSYPVVAKVQNVNYTGSATGTLKITQATPSVAWNAPAAITYGTALSATQLDARSTVAGSFSYSPPAGTIVAGGSQKLSATFTPTDTTDYTTATDSVMLTVNPATPVIALASSMNPSTVAQPVTFTATVSSPLGTPTGTVTFWDGTAQLGAGTLASGVATYATSALPVGTHAITAQYSGGSNFAGVTSTALGETVAALSIGPAPGYPTTGTGNPGGFVTYTLTVTPPGSSSVSFSISGLPAGFTSTFTPRTVPAGAGPTTVTLTINIPSQVSANSVPARPSSSSGWPVALGLLLFPLLAIGRRARRVNRLLLVAVLAVAGLIATAGLSGCSNYFSILGNSNPPPPGSYALTVTATAGSLTQSTNLTLNVR